MSNVAIGDVLGVDESTIREDKKADSGNPAPSAEEPAPPEPVPVGTAEALTEASGPAPG